MNSGICSQLKLEPDLQLDRKPFKRKRELLNDISNLGTNMVFQKNKYKKASDLGLFFYVYTNNCLSITSYKILTLFKLFHVV